METVGWVLYPSTSGERLKHWKIYIIPSEYIDNLVQALSAVHVRCILGKKGSFHPVTGG